MMLNVNQRDIDLGNLKFGVPHQFKYVITNDYNKKVIINRLVLGCKSCTVATTEKNILEPGESTNINVVFTPGSTGINSKKISIAHMTYEDNLFRPPVDVTFKAIVNG